MFFLKLVEFNSNKSILTKKKSPTKLSSNSSTNSLTSLSSNSSTDSLTSLSSEPITPSYSMNTFIKKVYHTITPKKRN